MKTANTYRYPVAHKKMRVTYTDSPAHTGRLSYAMDFIVPEGTPVKAALGGTVVDVKDDSDIGGPSESFDKFGNYVEIQHPHGEYSIYEHIRKGGALVSVGDRVRTDQVIALSGNTGWTAHLGPHVHFDVHRYHEPYGPDDYKTMEIRWEQRRRTKRGNEAK